MIEMRGIDLSEMAVERRYHRDGQHVKGNAPHVLAGLIPKGKLSAKTTAFCLKFDTARHFNRPGPTD
ncbi:MAG TPA: hypothetical protein VNV38_08695 [Stellaceae bacterium]|nr:hypothetical protein [Stellaceae bacterium]